MSNQSEKRGCRSCGNLHYHQTDCTFWQRSHSIATPVLDSERVPAVIRHALGRPCGAQPDEAEMITEYPERVTCRACLAAPQPQPEAEQVCAECHHSNPNGQACVDIGSRTCCCRCAFPAPLGERETNQPSVEREGGARHVITRDEANRVWDILETHAGAHSMGRESFIASVEGKTNVNEYRFQGALGFGGKVYYRRYDNPPHWGVYCYSEERNPGRDEVLRKTNEALRTIALEPVAAQVEPHDFGIEEIYISKDSQLWGRWFVSDNGVPKAIRFVRADITTAKPAETPLTVEAAQREVWDEAINLVKPLWTVNKNAEWNDAINRCISTLEAARDKALNTQQRSKVE